MLLSDTFEASKKNSLIEVILIVLAATKAFVRSKLGTESAQLMLSNHRILVEIIRWERSNEEQQIEAVY